MKKIVLAVPLLTIFLLASCGKVPAKEYEVTATSGITVSNAFAYSNKDYETTLIVNEDKMVLADEPTKVTINGSESTNYTYSLNDSKNEALFSIQKEYITGSINIELDFGYPVICANENVTFTKTIAAKNENYETELTSSAPNVLPDKLTKITINGEEPTYKYVPDMARHATLSIEENVTGPIEIELITGIGHSIFCSSSDVVFSKRIVVENQKYEADLTIKDGKTGISFPATKEGIKVEINKAETSNFAYSQTDSTHASFSVEEAYVTGDITISIPLIYTVTYNKELIQIDKETATFGSDYEATLSTYVSTKGMPSSIKITIGQFVIGANAYTYTPNPYEPKEATLKIPAIRIKGPISIELSGLVDIYSASIEVITGETVTLTNEKVSPAVDYETEISFNNETYTNLKMPTTLKSVTSGSSSVEDYEYTPDPNNANKATLKIDKSQIIGDIKITIEFRWFDYEDWWNYCTDGDNKVKATEADIGKEVTASVNNTMHQVRLIDIEHDGLADKSGKAHCTFEFVNIITIGWLTEKYQIHWNDSGGLFSTNFEYRESTLNNFLNNDTRCVLSLLPESLRNVIKQVDKKVGVSTDEGRNYTATSFDGETHSYPYLFPLAHDEMINNESDVTKDEGSKYQYYINHSAQEYRIKKDVGGKVREYWLRSPNTAYRNYAWSVGTDGFVYGHHGNISSSGFGVAPAFCI